MAKYRFYFRRSEYERALDNYHRARRRGDAADANRWLKAADMHLRVANRFAEGVHASLMRETEYEEARVRSARLAQEREALERANASRTASARLEALMERAEREVAEQMAAENEYG